MENFKISDDKIDAAKKIFQRLHGWSASRKSLNYFFGEYHENANEDVVIMKVCMINQLYRTSLMKPVDIAKYIVCNFEKFDNLLYREKDPSAAVEFIRWCQTKTKQVEKGRKGLLSFASKYCHFHKNEKYPLYDRYVSVALKYLMPERWHDPQAPRYSDFCAVFDALRGDVSLPDADIYLWLYGVRRVLEREAETKKKEIISQEVRGLYEDDAPARRLFSAL